MSEPKNLSAKYNTPLTNAQQVAYDAWAIANNRTGDSYDYDMQGAWLQMRKGSVKQDSRGHFPDTFKKPNHPTFSNESKYNGVAGNKGGTWSKDKKGNDVYTASATNLKNMDVGALQQYFNKVEPHATLITGPAEMQVGFDTKNADAAALHATPNTQAAAAQAQMKKGFKGGN